MYLQTSAVRTDNPAFPAAATAYGDSAEWLVRQYKPLVRRIAWQVHGRAARDGQLDDLIQVGFMALIEASRAYVDQGHNFVTYATTRIRGSMIDHLRSEMMTARSAARQSRRIDAARHNLGQKLRRSPSSAEIARELGMTDQKYMQVEQQAVAGQRLSIDDMDDAMIDLMQGCDTGASDAIEQADLMAMLRKMIGDLSEREQLVLHLYFAEELNLHEIGAVLGVSAARACQIKAGAVARLQTGMRECTKG